MTDLESHSFCRVLNFKFCMPAHYLTAKCLAIIYLKVVLGAMNEILFGSVHGIEMPELPGEVGSFAYTLQSLEDFL